MKRTKEEPSVTGLLLIVAGLLLLSITLLVLLSSGTTTSSSGKVLLGLSCAALVCLATGAGLSGRKRKSSRR